MKTTTLARHGVSIEMVGLIGRLVELIAWPARRRAMGDVTIVLLDGKRRVAENVFGWNRRAIEVGIHEYQTGIACVNDISSRVKPKTEDEYPPSCWLKYRPSWSLTANPSRVCVPPCYTPIWRPRPSMRRLFRKDGQRNPCLVCARSPIS